MYRVATFVAWEWLRSLGCRLVFDIRVGPLGSVACRTLFRILGVLIITSPRFKVYDSMVV